LYLFAGALSAYNIYQVVDETRADHPQSLKNGLSLRLVIHGHTFTSPDNPVMEVDNDIPQRFIDGCDGDLKEARRRWDITRHWRESEGVNTILDEPQPYFSLIRSMYPHYFCGRGKQGNTIYYERPGDFEGSQLYARGVKNDDLVRHWLFVTEYQWNILCGGDETAKAITVLDIGNVKMGDLAGSNMECLKKTINIANQHYPERSFVILIVNAPYFFSFLWKIVKPLVHENTQKKIKILSPKETLKGMMEFIEIDQIPEYYGGKLDYGGHDSCRFHNPDSANLVEYVRKLNEKHAIVGEGDNAVKDAGYIGMSGGGTTVSGVNPMYANGPGGISNPATNSSNGSTGVTSASTFSSSSNGGYDHSGSGGSMPPGNPGDMPTPPSTPTTTGGTSVQRAAMARRASLNSPSQQPQRRGSHSGGNAMGGPAAAAAAAAAASPASRGKQ
jgi:hypothetical protein